MTDTIRVLTTIGDSSHIDLAVASWLDAHSKSKKTVEAYADTMAQYRGELHRIGHDLDSDVSMLAMVAQRFAAFTQNPHKEQVSDNTYNLRLALLSSFYVGYTIQPGEYRGYLPEGKAILFHQSPPWNSFPERVHMWQLPG